MSEGEGFIFTRVDGDWGDESDFFLDLGCYIIAVCDTAGEKDLVYFAVKYGCHGADFFGNLVSECVEYTGCFFVTLFKGTFCNVAHVVGSKVSVETAFPVDLFIYFSLCVLTGETHFYECACRYTAGTFR